LTNRASLSDPTFKITCRARSADARDRVRLAALLLTYVGTIALQTRSLMRLLAPRDLACVHTRTGRFACKGYVPYMHGDRPFIIYCAWPSTTSVSDACRCKLVLTKRMRRACCARKILGRCSKWQPTARSYVQRDPVHRTNQGVYTCRPVWHESIRTRCEIINAVGEMMIVILLAPGAHPTPSSDDALHPRSC